MKRHSSLVPLSHQHRDGLFCARILKRVPSSFSDVPQTPAEKLAYAQRVYSRELAPHFGVEERILQPAIRGRDPRIDALLEQMLQEHHTLRELFGSLGEAQDLEAALDSLGHALEQHIRMEERELFERVQAELTEAELRALGLELKAALDSI